MSFAEGCEEPFERDVEGVAEGVPGADAADGAALLDFDESASGQACLGGEGGQFGLPQSGAGAVGSTAVGGDQYSRCGGVGVGAHGVPPAADGLDGECSGVVIGAHADPAGVRGEVVNSISVGLAQVPVDEVVDLDLVGFAGGAPFPPGVLVLAGS